ncbi:RNA helicase [Saitoella coloradoensis]
MSRDIRIPNFFQGVPRRYPPNNPSRPKQPYFKYTPFGAQDVPYSQFRLILERILDRMISNPVSSPRSKLSKQGVGENELTLACSDFKEALLSGPEQQYNSPPKNDKFARGAAEVPDLFELRKTYVEKGSAALATLLTESFETYAIAHATPKADLALQHSVADARYPGEWYPAAREMSRHITLHVGPTNSGKTHSALSRLASAERGMFAGPLRLLALEIWERMNKMGVPCNLITGDEKREVDDARIISSTIEMTDLDHPYDVAVFDEIQMIGDVERGGGWTNALLGVRAKEIHLCGEESVVDLVTRLAESVGDTVEVKRYHRLGALEVQEKSLEGDLSKIENGDCVVTFSRKNIFAIKRRIEEMTGKRCAVIYGSLPPETRAAQASLFNDPDSGFDVLVASDAIGMGLNLSIKRIVFETLQKWDGQKQVQIAPPQIKQIAGRAGRYKPNTRTSESAVIEEPLTEPIPGYVTTLISRDMPVLAAAMKTPVIQLPKAGLQPGPGIMARFGALFPVETPYMVVMKRFYSMLRMSSLYFPSAGQNLWETAGIVSRVKGLTFEQHWVLSMAPIKLGDPRSVAALLDVAQKIATGTDGSILAIRGIDLEALDEGLPRTTESLQRIESLHRVLGMYTWLCAKFPKVLTSASEATMLKTVCEETMDQALRELAYEKLQHARKGGHLRESERWVNAMEMRGMREMQWSGARDVRSGKGGQNFLKDDMEDPGFFGDRQEDRGMPRNTPLRLNFKKGFHVSPSQASAAQDLVQAVRRAGPRAPAPAPVRGSDWGSERRRARVEELLGELSRGNSGRGRA